jgi:hypothetical protein
MKGTAMVKMIRPIRAGDLPSLASIYRDSVGGDDACMGFGGLQAHGSRVAPA